MDHTFTHAYIYIRIYIYSIGTSTFEGRIRIFEATFGFTSGANKAYLHYNHHESRVRISRVKNSTHYSILEQKTLSPNLYDQRTTCPDVLILPDEPNSSYNFILLVPFSVDHGKTQHQCLSMSHLQKQKRDRNNKSQIFVSRKPQNRTVATTLDHSTKIQYLRLIPS